MSNYLYVGLLGDVYKMHRRDATEMLEDYLEGNNGYVTSSGNTQYADLDIEDYGAKRLSDRVGRGKRNNLQVQFNVENLYDAYDGPDKYYINDLLDAI